MSNDLLIIIICIVFPPALFVVIPLFLYGLSCGHGKHTDPAVREAAWHKEARVEHERYVAEYITDKPYTGQSVFYKGMVKVTTRRCPQRPTTDIMSRKTYYA